MFIEQHAFHVFVTCYRDRADACGEPAAHDGHADVMGTASRASQVRRMLTYSLPARAIQNTITNKVLLNIVLRPMHLTIKV